MSDVYSYIASEIKGEHIAWVNVTNPLAEASVYEKAIKEYNHMDVKFDCLLSVYEVKDYLFYNGKPVNFQPNPWPKSQDLTGVCAMSYVINILRRFTPEIVVLDGSVPVWKAGKLANEFIKYDIDCINTSTDGAYISVL